MKIGSGGLLAEEGDGKRRDLPAAATERVQRGEMKLGLGYARFGILYHRALSGLYWTMGWAENLNEAEFFDRFVHLPGPNEMAEFWPEFVFFGRNPKPCSREAF